MNIYFERDIVDRYPDYPTVVMLYPFLGVYPEALHDKKSVMKNRFDRYCQTCDYFEITDKPNSDFFVFPLEWFAFQNHPNKKNILDAYIGEAQKYHRKVILFAYGDHYVDLPEYDDHLIIFQSNLSTSKKKITHHAMPTFIEDLLGQEDHFLARARAYIRSLGAKSHVPKISFCGFPGSSPIREKAISVLKETSLVRTNMILREKYFAGAWEKKKNGYNYRVLKKVRKQYVENLTGSDYVLCVRGFGNYSARFYESLCCGRIPVYINSDSVLPFRDQIPYNDIMVEIPENQVGDFPRIINKMHESLSPKDLKDMQTQCRSSWEKYLSPSGFFENMHQLL